MSATGPRDTAVAEAVDRLVEEQRVTSLWFLRPDYYPATTSQRIRVLEHIERHGDLDSFRRAATLRRWLSQHSSAESADS
ncbi:MAG TPA: hypothetical protein VID93_11270 [Acidimicrobiales bacterium]